MSVARAREQRVMSCRCGELVRLDAELSGANVLDDLPPPLDDLPLDLPDDDDDEATRLITTIPRKLTLSSLGSNPHASTAPRDQRWFVNLNGSHTVEMSTTEVLAARMDGRVGRDALVWRPGMVGWQPVRNVLKAPGLNDGERAPARPVSAPELAPLPPAPRVPSTGSLGPPLPTPPRAPVRQSTVDRELSPPPVARSGQASDPSLGVYERAVATIDFKARAARSTPPPPAPPSRPADRARTAIPSIPPVRLPPSDHRSATIPPTRTAPRAPVPSVSSPPAPVPTLVVKTLSEPARAPYSASRAEDTAVSRARAQRRRMLTGAIGVGAAVALVVAGALVTRAIRGAKRHTDSVAAAVPTGTATPLTAAHVRTKPAAADLPSPDAPAVAGADDVVSVENLPTSDRTEGSHRAQRRWATARATVTSGASVPVAKQRAADQIVLEEESSQPSEPAKPAAAPTGKPAKAASTTTQPATPPPAPPSDALNNPGF